MEDPFKKVPKNKPEGLEQLTELVILFSEAEIALEKEGRDKAKTCLPDIYDRLMTLNKRDENDFANVWVWNPSGYLSKDIFDKLNLRRKLLSNAIGIMTASGVVRHDLNKID